MNLILKEPEAHMVNADNFLPYDKGRKDARLSPVRCQVDLKRALEHLSGGNETAYIRQVLIVHVREQLRDRNPRLSNFQLSIKPNYDQ